MAEPPGPKPRCRALPDAQKGFFLSSSRRQKPTTDGGAEDDDLPFAPEIGTAIPFRKGFAVGALDPSRSSTVALVILVGDGAPRRIELGAVHGDVLPPLVAPAKDSLVVAVPDGAPNGMLVRLLRVDDPGVGSKISWGAEIPVGHDESDAFSLEVGDRTSVLAWDETESGRSIVRCVTFAASEASKTSPARTLSPPGEEAESPLLIRRQGGFWAAWVTSGTATKRAPGASRSQEPGPDTEPLDMGPRWVTVVPLDDSGQPASAAIAVTSRSGHVMGFDLVEGPGGGVLVAVRDDTTSPATSGGAVRVAAVHADGSVDLRAIPAEDIGSSAPAFLVDRSPSGERRVWLSLATDSETVRVVPLDAEGHVIGEASVESALRQATPLAMSSSSLLAAYPRNGGVSMDLFSCEPGTPIAAKEPVRP